MSAETRAEARARRARERALEDQLDAEEEAADPAGGKLELITVRSGLAPDKVALWEVHPQHPKTEAQPDGGETYVYGVETFEVARTPEVQARLRAGTLVQVEGKGKRARAVPAAEQQPEAPPAPPAAPDETTTADGQPARTPQERAAVAEQQQADRQAGGDKPPAR